MSASILGIDAATDAYSVAINTDNNIFYEKFAVAPQQHAKLLLKTIHELLSKAKMHLHDLDGLAFSQGPGSFTGLRIASSIIQALGYGANLPIIMVPTLQALAQNVSIQANGREVLAILDARMGEIYWGLYKSDLDGYMQVVIPERVQAPECVLNLKDKARLAVGTGAVLYKQLFTSSWKNLSIETETLYPQARDIVKIAQIKYANDEICKAKSAIPVYCRNSVTG